MKQDSDQQLQQALALPDLQREVQRRLGRNLIRLQQIERLMKVMVAEQEIAGSASEIEAERRRRHVEVEKKTLGQVAGDYSETVIASEGSPELEWEPADPSIPGFRMSFRVAMSKEDLAVRQSQLAELVELRNRLVHHFLELQDIWTESGCRKACAYLDESFEVINLHFEELRQVGLAMEQARRTMGEFLETKEFEDCLVHGILPGGSGVIWPISSIVELLRDAERALVSDGWTSLEDAIIWMRKIQPDQTPSRYGCRSWRQVLHESKLFEIRRAEVPGGINGRRQTYYRGLASPE